MHVLLEFQLRGHERFLAEVAAELAVRIQQKEPISNQCTPRLDPNLSVHLYEKLACVKRERVCENEQ